MFHSFLFLRRSSSSVIQPSPPFLKTANENNGNHVLSGRQPFVTNVDHFLANVSASSSSCSPQTFFAGNENGGALPPHALSSSSARPLSPPTLTTYHAFERPGDECGELELVVVDDRYISFEDSICAVAYQVGTTRSRTITEVKQH